MEYDLELEKELLEIVKNNPKNYMRVIKSTGFMNRYPNRQYLRDYISKCTVSLVDSEEFTYGLKTRLYWTLNHIWSWDDERVCCKIDGNPIKNWNVVNLEQEYKKTCCPECSRKLAYSELEKSNLARYGVRNPFQFPHVLKKFKEHKDERMAHRRATRLKHYGDPNFNNPKKAQETKIKKYGDVWNLKKCKETWRKKYGVENPMQVDRIREKQQSAQYVYDDRKFDCSWEVYLYIYFKDHGVNFIYQPQEPKLWYQKGDQSWHRYYPDFLLVDSNQLIETKGDNSFDENGNPIKNGWLDWKEKYECMKAHGVKILLKKDVEPYREYVEKKYGKDFIRSLLIQQRPAASQGLDDNSL